MLRRVIGKVDTKIFQKSLRSNYSTIVHTQNVKSMFAEQLQAFNALPYLHFENQIQFTHSDFYEKLNLVLNHHFKLNPYSGVAIQTISMKETLQYLGLDTAYAEFIDEDKCLIGTHGASFLSLPHLIPHPLVIKKMPTYHNPFHTENGPVWFFYGDNISMALHYSELNSIHTEIITGDSDAHYFPDRIGILGFAPKHLIDQINLTHPSGSQKPEQNIPVGSTEAWGQRNGGMPDNFKIGHDVRVPAFYHSQISNMLVFSIKGTKRQFPLDEGVQYHEGQSCRWTKGIGYTNE